MDSEVLTMEGADHHHVETNKVTRHERSDLSEESWRANKIFKPNDFDLSLKDALSEQGSFFMRSGSMVSGDDGQTMLCFSSTSSKAQEASFLGGDTSSRNQELAIFQAQQPSLYAKGNVSARCPEGVNGPFSRFKGPFTPSQWMELEHQALIYKHIVANVPVPLNLLIPFKKSLNPYAFSSLSSGSYVSNPLGWGSFHLGFSGNTDPEPGRCRRTDGKKWRCSRDACPDQKYCERHINRGRHRSRKPVEGQTGHAVSGSTAPKVAPFASSSASVMSSSSAANSLGAIQHQFTNSRPSSASPSTNHLVSRIHNPQSLMSDDSPFSAQKQHAAFEDSTQEAFGLVSSDSLLNPSQKGSFMTSGNSSSIPSFNGEETQAQNPLHLFIDKWPKPQSDSASVVWPGELKSDWTQLSMSIPMTSSDFLSSSNSHAKKLTLSPLRLAGQFDPIQMGLSVSNNSDKSIEKQTHWRPLPWENSMGGPLGEVLIKTPINPAGNKNSSPLNLGTEGWGSSPQLRSSPTGVLQKSSFISLSNSSAGSSPRGDNNEAREAANFCNDLLGSTLASSSCTPSL